MLPLHNGGAVLRELRKLPVLNELLNSGFTIYGSFVRWLCEYFVESGAEATHVHMMAELLSGRDLDFRGPRLTETVVKALKKHGAIMEYMGGISHREQWHYMKVTECFGTEKISGTCGGGWYHHGTYKCWIPVQDKWIQYDITVTTDDIINLVDVEANSGAIWAVRDMNGYICHHVEYAFDAVRSRVAKLRYQKGHGLFAHECRIPFRLNKLIKAGYSIKGLDYLEELKERLEEMDPKEHVTYDLSSDGPSRPFCPNLTYETFGGEVRNVSVEEVIEEIEEVLFIEW